MKKNKKIIVVVFVMLLTVSIALAYFVGRTLLDGKGASTTVTTANIHGATLKVEGELNFNAEGMLPGHKDISRIKVTATGNNELIPYNLIWTGTNTLATNLKFTVYKTSSQVETSSTCKKHDEQVSGGRKLYETCNIKNENLMGEVLTTGTISSSEESIKVELAKDEFINATPDGQIVYYYIIIEYPNENNDQYPKDKGGSFDGVINAEASDTKPDINIIAAYIQNKDTGKYDKTDEIPQDGYIINQEKTVCNNGAVPGYDYNNKRVYFEKLTKSGTECELYFDKIKTSKDVLADLGLEESKTDCPIVEDGISKVTGVEKSQSLICSVPDDDGESYYFRGTTDNNWVKFGRASDGKDIWWRIIRINGNGSLRLIYAGVGNEAPTGNGTYALYKVKYNLEGADNTYMGFYNQSTVPTTIYLDAHEGTNPSNIASQLNAWFIETNLDERTQLNHFDENAGFCNDRNIGMSNYGIASYKNEGYGNKDTWYAPFDRVAQSDNSTSYSTIEQNPTLKCANKERDLYTISKSTQGNQKLTNPVGLITMDEIILAGGFGNTTNTGYWLCISLPYWTMTPYRYSGVATMFYFNTNGGLGDIPVYNEYPNVRPVINLKADTKFKYNNDTTKGTKEDPYIVID